MIPRREIRGKKCPHDIGKLFVYRGTKEKEAWWCSICDADLYKDAGSPETFGQGRTKKGGK